MCTYSQMPLDPWFWLAWNRAILSNSTKLAPKLLQSYSWCAAGNYSKTTLPNGLQIKKTTQFEVGECATPRNKRPLTRGRNSHPRNGGTKTATKAATARQSHPTDEQPKQASQHLHSARISLAQRTRNRHAKNANQAQAPQWRAQDPDTTGSRTKTATPAASASNSPPRTITRKNSANNTGHKQPPCK